MSSAGNIPCPQNEVDRLAAVQRYQLLDTPPEAEFDFLAHVAAIICHTPYAFVSLVGSDRVWYKSAWGKAACQAPRDQDYCSWAILERDHLHIPDLDHDSRTADLPSTHGFPNYRMYCGANLVDSAGHCIGTICVLDVVPRVLSAETISLLKHLGKRGFIHCGVDRHQWGCNARRLLQSIAVLLTAKGNAAVRPSGGEQTAGNRSALP